MKKPIIAFKNFTFKYRSQTEPSLKNINLTIHEGEKVLIVGPSGSGKSTLAHCINGLVPFSYKGDITGSLTIKSRETKELDLFSLSKMVGTVMQDPDGQFIGLTVGEDIAFALENEAVASELMKERVERVAQLVNMDSYLEASIHHLSGGQKQRVSLGGVMVDDVDILLFDEPLANLDPATGKYSISLIDQIHEESNKTIVMIEHRLEDVLYRKVDRIIVISDGEIVSDTSPDELFSTSVLAENSIREPLYVRAMKYAGCRIHAKMKPAHPETIEINKKKLHDWYKSLPNQTPSLESKPVLEVDHVTFAYDTGKTAIQDMSFTIYQGEMVSIVGQNGAGKSTISKIIVGFEKVQNGTILFKGEDITSDSIHQRSERIGLVMQNPNQMISKHLIYDEVALGLVKRGIEANVIKERVEKTLRICGLYPFRNWPISALSFGQKKRVTIASILVLEPEVLILDEPTAGQDFRHYTEIMDFLEVLNKRGITIIMITHDMHLMLEYTPRAIAIAQGRKIADDTAVNVLTNQTVIDASNLKVTSLFGLAVRAEIADPREFVARFIAYDREMRTWQ
ncbi:ABC transporter ATP-binding protein [Oceanobacillus manasiensis]|uniref:ABC transporter ATP-binding protein n=1 Tax=Oceanobacillus manasiensis TaxID=586413 RepID=UPI0005A634B6|nr:ABC transporter ATP-binding protein [Oceanobacillus manasiensis]